MSDFSLNFDGVDSVNDGPGGPNENNIDNNCNDGRDFNLRRSSGSIDKVLKPVRI